METTPMYNNLKRVLLWSIYVFGAVAVLIFIIFPLFLQLYGDILFPTSEFDRMLDAIVGASLILGIASVALGVFSVWQMKSGTKATEKATDRIDDIWRKLTLLERYFLLRPNIDTKYVDISNKKWKPDDTPDAPDA
jgi:hypothetical protein